jgi:hypothetical protein
MKKLLLAASAATCISSAASATVMTNFTATPNSISVGDQSVLDLQLSITSDPGYFGAYFTGGDVQINPVNGQGAIDFTVLNGNSFQPVSPG